MPLLVLCAVLATVIFIPLKVTGHGYLPPDDALRHAGKVSSGKGWGDILVLRDDIKTDSHPGWHAILGGVRRLTAWNAESIVVFSVIFLFILFCVIPVFIFNRPEAWVMSLLTITVMQPSLITRLFLGRPYILTMSVILVLCLLWPRLRGERIPYSALTILTFLIAASTWIHCSWHLLALPLAAFCLAREWRVLGRLSLSFALGILLGALLTGHPYLFLKQTLFHTIGAFSSHQLQRMLVGEFQPFAGNGLMVMAIIAMISWRKIRGSWNNKVIDNPVFILAIIGWALGFVSRRFWLDWGMPAMAIWMAFEFKEVLEKKIGFSSFRRLFLSLAVAGTFYLSLASDIGGRWTYNLTKEYLSAENPEHRLWLPEPGGIVYSDDMAIFYDTFFKNPNAPWRYILGFEPAMMPAEDLAIFRKIQWNFGDDKAFRGWVKKMRPEDRLIIRGNKSNPPGIMKLEWHYAATGTWIGRRRDDGR